jgi:hypothetical protein
MRILAKRKFKSKFPQWIGRTFSLKIHHARNMIEIMKQMELELTVLDKDRIEAAKAEIKKKKGRIYRIPQRRMDEEEGEITID